MEYCANLVNAGCRASSAAYLSTRTRIYAVSYRLTANWHIRILRELFYGRGGYSHSAFCQPAVWSVAVGL